MQSECENCQSSGAKHSRFANLMLCSKCEAEMESLEQERIKERRDEVKKLIEGNKVQPSLAFMLAFQKLNHLKSSIVSDSKIPDYVNANLLPLVHLMSTDDIERLLPIIKTFYFALNAAVEMRHVDNTREAFAIKAHQKREKTRAKAEVEIAKQKKHASKDRTLSKEERARAKVLEGLTAAFGGDEKAAMQAMENALRGKK